MWRKLSEVYSCDSTHCNKIGKKVQSSNISVFWPKKSPGSLATYIWKNLFAIFFQFLRALSEYWRSAKKLDVAPYQVFSSNLCTFFIECFFVWLSIIFMPAVYKYQIISIFFYYFIGNSLWIWIDFVMSRSCDVNNWISWAKFWSRASKSGITVWN